MKILALVTSLMFIGGCSAITQSSSGSDTISGRVSAGPVGGATVTLNALADDGTIGATLGTAITAADGSYTLKLVAPVTGNTILTAVNGIYFEEATPDVPVTLGTMRTVLSAVNTSRQYGVSPASEIAASATLAAVAGSVVPLATLIDTTNTAIAQQFGLDDITIAPLNPNVTVADPSSAAAKLTLALATLSEMAANSATAEGSVITSQDIASTLATNFIANGSFDPAVSNLANVALSANASSRNVSAQVVSLVTPSASTTLDVSTLISNVGDGSATTFADAFASAANTYKASAPAIAAGLNAVAVPTANSGNTTSVANTNVSSITSSDLGSTTSLSAPTVNTISAR